MVYCVKINQQNYQLLLNVFDGCIQYLMEIKPTDSTDYKYDTLTPSVLFFCTESELTHRRSPVHCEIKFFNIMH